MKKITLILITLITFSGFGQSISWDNKPGEAYAGGPPLVRGGDMIDIDITYDAGPGRTVNYIHVVFTDLTAGWAVEYDYTDGQHFIGSGQPQTLPDPNNGSLTVSNFQIPDVDPDNNPATEPNWFNNIDDGGANPYMVRVYMELDNFTYYNGNTWVFLGYRLSADKFNMEELAFYPNPVMDAIHLKKNLAAEKYEIRNLTGQMVRQGDFNRDIDVSTLSPGLYFLGIDKSFTKFIKQ